MNFTYILSYKTLFNIMTINDFSERKACLKHLVISFTIKQIQGGRVPGRNTSQLNHLTFQMFGPYSRFSHGSMFSPQSSRKVLFL